MRHDEALGDVHQAVGRLHHVTEQLLVLMRSEQDTGQPLTLAPVDLAALARAEVERWTDSALDKDIDLGYEGPAGPYGDGGAMTVAGEAHLLRELLANLIDNAIRYSGRNGVVTVTLSAMAPPEPGAPAVMLAVDDDGPGIPEAERSLVLERFYRGSNGAASAGDAGGCGLGLPIAHEIAARHGATLTIAARAPGTRVLVVFPGAAA